jgi:hypothetical protein
MLYKHCLDLLTVGIDIDPFLPGYHILDFV